MTQTRRRFPESFKREAVDQVPAGTPLRHVAETLSIAESLLGTCKLQYEQQDDDALVRVRSCVGYASNWLRSPWSAMF
jgi:transposase